MLIKAHQPCDKCNSTDALAIYTNGSKCFSCGHRTKSNNHSLFANCDGNYKIGTTITDAFTKEALAYLLKYRIFIEDIKQSGIKYDPNSRRILFPINDDSYQGRSLDKDKIKYMTYGNKSYKRFGDGDIVVLCEDWLSSYRVSQQEGVSSVCIFGTSCKASELLKIVNNHCTIIIWLDGDKPGQDAAKKLTKELALYYRELYNIVTPNDPKTYSDAEIRGILYERTGTYEGGIK